MWMIALSTLHSSLWVIAGRMWLWTGRRTMWMRWIPEFREQTFVAGDSLENRSYFFTKQFGIDHWVWMRDTCFSETFMLLYYKSEVLRCTSKFLFCFLYMYYWMHKRIPIISITEIFFLFVVRMLCAES